MLYTTPYHPLQSTIGNELESADSTSADSSSFFQGDVMIFYFVGYVSFSSVSLY